MLLQSRRRLHVTKQWRRCHNRGVKSASLKLFQQKRRVFPDPAVESIDGIVAMGDQLNVSTLFEAYSFGIFPWPHPDLPTLWYSPDPRGVLDFSELHVGRSLRKFLRDSPFEVTFNTCFRDVMKRCSEVPRPGQEGTWINSGLIRAYEEFHAAGYAHSVEVWSSSEDSRGDRGSLQSDSNKTHERHLVGGLYGVYVAGVFSGESMFFSESNASKVALLSTIEMLQANGLTWMDIQMVTPVTEALGGKYILRDEFLRRLELAKLTAAPLKF